MSPGPDRDAAYARLLPLVGSIARGLMRVYRCGEYADVFQDGCLGMLRAVETYDESRGVPLEAHARRRISGSILNGIRNRDPVSEYARTLLRDAERARDQAATSGDGPTMNEMAARLSGLGAALLMEHRAKTMSLDEPLPPGERLAPNWDEDPAHIVARRDDAAQLARAIGELTERQRTVIASYYYAGKTVAHVGEELSVSTQRVSQLHQTALTNMRKRLVGA